MRNNCPQCSVGVKLVPVVGNTEIISFSETYKMTTEMWSGCVSRRLTPESVFCIGSAINRLKRQAVNLKDGGSSPSRCAKSRNTNH